MKEIRLFLRILAYVLVLPFWLRAMKLPELCRKLSGANACTGLPLEKVIFYCKWLTWPRIPFFKNYCLWRCLVFYKFLQENGVKVALNMGVRVDEKGRLRGHSWLTRDGRPYLSDPLVTQKFKLIYAYPEA